MRADQLKSARSDIAGGQVETLANQAAQYLNREARAPMGEGMEDLARALKLLGTEDAAAARPADLVDAVRGLKSTGREGDLNTLARILAEQRGPSLGQRAVSGLAGFNDLISRNTTGGAAARVGVYGGATAGTAMGLTAAGQGLMALMEYLQTGDQVAEQREQPLT